MNQNSFNREANLTRRSADAALGGTYTPSQFAYAPCWTM
jgi:hypothetical protein